LSLYQAEDLILFCLKNNVKRFYFVQLILRSLPGPTYEARAQSNLK